MKKVCIIMLYTYRVRPAPLCIFMELFGSVKCERVRPPSINEMPMGELFKQYFNNEIKCKSKIHKHKVEKEEFLTAKQKQTLIGLDNIP